MSSPPRDAAQSPQTGRGGSPVRRRGSTSVSTSDISDPIPRPRMSPTLARSYDPNDPHALERQRTLDVDIAMQLSRARRETIVASPVTSPFEHSQPIEHHDSTFPSLSPHEQHEVDMARGERPHLVDNDAGEVPDTAPTQSTREPSPIDLHVSHLHQTQDPSLLVGLGHQPSQTLPDADEPSSSVYGLPTYQPNVSQSNFDFAVMEAFSNEEKTQLGFTSSVTGSSGSALMHSSSPTPIDPTISLYSTAASGGPFDPSLSAPRRVRQRKLSQSNPNPRLHRKGGKIAAFEGTPRAPPPSLPGRSMFGFGNEGSTLSAVPSYDNITAGTLGNNGMLPPMTPVTPGLGGTPVMGILNTGHDRPYRFSFYSNAQSATIHARSLSELPADGQTFEELFSGIGSPRERSGSKSTARDGHAAPPDPTASAKLPFSHLTDTSKRVSPSPSVVGDGRSNQETPSSHLQVPGYFANSGSKNGAGDQKPTGKANFIRNAGDFEGNTWWLDIQSPTDEEMKMLSKVFSIHPLTTEDIQMEETREKIELFRNYYLVCFRSFDQDPYSPTHLEPLNMYIIVFREGILSFHFRPTPHPQNVRRRIKQLKDYISVTSDWISYALIDDITDAFGPLIQNIEYEVDNIDEVVLILKEAEQSDMLRRIGTCRKKVMGLLRLMGNKADVVKGLAKRCNENWRVAPTSDIGLYLSDIQDHLITMTQNLNHYEKILSRSHSNYLAQISIEMTEANNQINDVLSKLTALGTVLIPMNLVTGLWGMNVHVPGQNIDGYAWFISIIAGLAAFAIIGGYSTYKFMLRR